MNKTQKEIGRVEDARLGKICAAPRFLGSHGAVLHLDQRHKKTASRPGQGRRFVSRGCLDASCRTIPEEVARIRGLPYSGGVAKLRLERFPGLSLAGSGRFWRPLSRNVSPPTMLEALACFRELPLSRRFRCGLRLVRVLKHPVFALSQAFCLIKTKDPVACSVGVFARKLPGDLKV